MAEALLAGVPVILGREVGIGSYAEIAGAGRGGQGLVERYVERYRPASH